MDATKDAKALVFAAKVNPVAFLLDGVLRIHIPSVRHRHRLNKS
jgi:hypothetical protein